MLLLTLCFAVNVTGATLGEQADSRTPDGAASYKAGELLVKLREGVAATDSHALARSLGVSHAKRIGAPRKDTGPAARQLKRWWVVQLPPGVTTEAALGRLQGNPDVEVVEPNFVRTFYSIPNDSRFNELWGMNNTGQLGGTIDADIDAPEAWDSQTGSGGVVVAVIDSGIDYNHEDLAANIWTNTSEIPANGIDDDGNGYIDDIHGYNFGYRNANPVDDVGHGTHVAGIISAVGNNGLGVTGVSWAAKLMALKVNNVFGQIEVKDTVEALVYAMDMGADVVNVSFGRTGTQTRSVAEEDAIKAVNEANILFVAAAGNTTNDNDFNPSYPAGYDIPNIIAVAATDRYDNLGSMSNYGASSVDLGAPGVEILSTVPTGTCNGCDPSGYRTFDGTSAAAPYVAGAAALLLSRSPALSVQDLKAVLLNSVDPVAALAGKTVTGGRLNLYNALGLLHYGAAFNPAVRAIPSDGSGASFTLTLTSYDNFTDTLTLHLDTLAAGLSGTLADTTVTLPANGTVSTTVNVATTAGMPRGAYPIRVVVTDSAGHAMTAEATLRILVPGFTVDITPDEQFGTPSTTLTYTVIVDAHDGFAGTVNLSAGASDRVIGTSLARSVTLPLNGRVATPLTVSIGKNAQLNTIYTLTVTATSGTKTAAATALVNLINTYDLVVTDIYVSSTTVYVGVPFTANATIKNQGTTYGPLQVGARFYLSSDPVLDSGDYAIGIGFYCGIYYPGMPAGATCDSGWNFTLTNVPPGTYYLFAEAYKVDGGSPAELNVANNVRMYGQITVKYEVDLTLGTLSLSSATVQEGGSLTVNTTVSNLGNSPVSGDVQVVFYLSANNVIDPEIDQVVGYWNIWSGIPANGSVPLTWTTQLNYVRSGPQYLLAMVDYANNFTETNETNNVRAAPITVTSNVDLYAQFAIPSKLILSPGETFTLDNQIANAGTSGTSWNGFYVGYYLSTDSSPQGALGTLIGSRYVDYLRAGDISPASAVPVTVPPDLPLGTYYLKLVADSTNSQVETNETNNVWVYYNPMIIQQPVQSTLSISAKASQTFVKQGSTLWAWGLNDVGQLGDGTTTTRLSPTQTATYTDWASFSSGFYHSVALKSNGTLWAWGENYYGQLGDGTTTNKLSPVQVGAATDWKSVSGGFEHTLAIKNDGTLWAWGANYYGQLGDGTQMEKSSPVQVGTATDWASVYAGTYQTIAIKTNGTLWAWGSNRYGQLGDGTTTDHYSPVQIGADTDWVSASAGVYYTVAVKSNGTLWAWGYNNYGQLGDGTTIDRLTPTRVGTDTDWKSVSTGASHTVAVKNNGTLWAWGYNLYGQLGDGTTTNKLSPVQVGTGTNWASASAGGYHTVAVKADDTLWTWGWNASGQLGDGTTTNNPNPVQVF